MALTRTDAVLVVVETVTAFRTKAPVNPLAEYGKRDLELIVVAAVSLIEAMGEHSARAGGLSVDELMKFLAERAVTQGIPD